MSNARKCFLIDNDKDDQEIFAMSLSGVDPAIQLYTADSGLQALQILKADPSFIPDCIFIDMNMPMMNGRECLREIKKLEHLHNTSVYMYSTSANPASVAEVKKLGVTDFIIKPTSFTALVALLKNLLS